MNNLPVFSGAGADNRNRPPAGTRSRKRHCLLFNFISLLSLAGITLLGTPYPVLGESAQDTPRPYILPGSEDVTVTASRTEEPVAFVPSNVTVLTSQDIRTSTARNLPELLSYAAGISVTDLTGGNRDYRVDMRGFGETSDANTLVLVDGRKVNQPDLSGTDWAQIPLSRVRRLEIVRGGRGGVLYGDNASAGVINIITGGHEQDMGRVSLLGGSYSSLALQGDYSGSSNNLDYAFSGDIHDSAGYRENSRTRGRNAGGSLNYTPNSRFGITVSTGIHHDETGMPGALTETDLDSGIPRSGTLYPNDRARITDWYFQARPRFLFLEDSRVEADISFRKRDNAFYSSSYWGYYHGNTELETFAFTPRLILSEPLASLDNRLTVGLDLGNSDEDILNTTSYSPQSAFFLEKNNLGAYFHDELFLAKNLALSGGYRYDLVKYGFGPSLAAKPEFEESLATAGISWQFNPGSNLFFEYGSGIRYPLLDEAFDFFSNSINSGLEPQESDSIQAGIKMFHPSSFFINSAFYNIRTDQEIFYNPAGGPYGFGANENFAGKNRRTGIEIESGMQIDRLTLTGSYTFTDSEVKDGLYAGSTVPGVPSHSFALKGIYLVNNKFDLSLEGIYTGERSFESDWGNDFPSQQDYFLLNSRLRYRISRVTLHLNLRNILNQEYSQYGVLGGYPTQRAYYPSPKFNLMGGITIDFQR